MGNSNRPVKCSAHSEITLPGNVQADSTRAVDVTVLRLKLRCWSISRQARLLQRSHVNRARGFRLVCEVAGSIFTTNEQTDRKKA